MRKQIGNTESTPGTIGSHIENIREKYRKQRGNRSKKKRSKQVINKWEANKKKMSRKQEQIGRKRKQIGNNRKHPGTIGGHIKASGEYTGRRGRE